MSSDTLLSIANLLLLEMLVQYFDMNKYEIKAEKIRFPKSLYQFRNDTYIRRKAKK